MHSREGAGMRGGKEEKMHVGVKAGAAALEMSPQVPAEALLPDSLGFSAVMRLASTSAGWASPGSVVMVIHLGESNVTFE